MRKFKVFYVQYELSYVYSYYIWIFLSKLCKMEEFFRIQGFVGLFFMIIDFLIFFEFNEEKNLVFNYILQEIKIIK